MYLHKEIKAAGPEGSPITRQPDLNDALIEAALLRGRKMRSEAFWNVLKAIARPIGRARAAFARYRKTQRALAELRGMDSHLLADIGLSRSDIERVARSGDNRGQARRAETRKAANDSTPERVAA